MNAKEEIKRLAERYADCGVTKKLLWGIMNLPDHGLDEEARLIGMRMLLGVKYNRTELFTPEQIAKLMGTTPEETLEIMRESGVNPITINIIPGGIMQ